MSYKVQVKFRDSEDNNHIYNKGDKYPRLGYAPTRQRIEYLESDKTNFYKPVIVKNVPKQETKKKNE